MRHRVFWTWLIPVMCVIAAGLLLSAVNAAAQPLPPAAVVCGEGLGNGSFEQNTDWTLPGTAYPAAYSTAKAHSGERSLRAGILMTVENIYSYSAANQTISFPTTVPTDVATATLTVWWWPISGESELTQTTATATLDHGTADQATLQAIVDGVAPAAPLAGDRQYVILTNENNKVITSLLWARSNAQEWQQATFDLTPYLGRALRVHIGVYNDGVGGVTAMYADDVAAQFCKNVGEALYMPLIRADATLTPTATPTATVTVTPTVEPTPTITPTIEPTPTPTTTVVWTDPSQAIEVFSPVADGLYHSPIEVRGLSQTFEGVVNMRLSAAGGEVLAERTAMGGSVDGFAFFDSYLRFTASEEISATLEVFEVSAKDGSEIHKVSIPLTLLPGQRVVDLTSPRTGDKLCSPIYVNGYSNTFEANVLVTLSARNGTVLTSTSTLGGNLGVYADFNTTLDHSVTAPQPVLVGVTEGSAAGFGYIDYTRVPVSLYPEGAGCPLPIR
jgi:hypothetical protein